MSKNDKPSCPFTPQQQWKEYRKKVIHPDASQEQIDDLQRAFYAGGFVVMQLHAYISNDVDDEELALSLLGQAARELRTFYNIQEAMAAMSTHPKHPKH